MIISKRTTCFSNHERRQSHEFSSQATRLPPCKPPCQPPCQPPANHFPTTSQPPPKAHFSVRKMAKPTSKSALHSQKTGGRFRIIILLSTFLFSLFTFPAAAHATYPMPRWQQLLASTRLYHSCATRVQQLCDRCSTAVVHLSHSCRTPSSPPEERRFYALSRAFRRLGRPSITTGLRIIVKVCSNNYDS